MLKSLMKALLALTLTFGAAQANDTMFGGNGATLLPIKNNNISMVDEHIVLEAFPRKDGPGIDHWTVTCVFHFKNETSKPQTVTMGFPFQRQYEHWLDPGDDWKERRNDYTPEWQRIYEQPYIRSFTTKVRGVDVQSKEIDINDARTPYKHAWIWDVTFAPGEQIEVINVYEHEEAGTSNGDQEIHYVLKTGKNWKGGKIGRSLLEVKPNMVFQFSFLDPAEISPKGAHIEDDGQFRKIVWDLKNFTPKTDLYFHFDPMDVELYEHLSPDTPVLKSGYDFEEEETCKDIRIQNHIYRAWFGYPFKSADLKAFFKKQWWYRENPDFDLEKLPKYARNLIITEEADYNASVKAKGCKK